MIVLVVSGGLVAFILCSFDYVAIVLVVSGAWWHSSRGIIRNFVIVLGVSGSLVAFILCAFS